MGKVISRDARPLKWDSWQSKGGPALVEQMPVSIMDRMDQSECVSWSFPVKTKDPLDQKRNPEGASESGKDLFQLATEDVVERVPGIFSRRVAFPWSDLDTNRDKNSGYCRKGDQ